MNKTLRKALLCLVCAACFAAVAFCITVFGTDKEPTEVIFYMGDSGYVLAQDQTRTFTTNEAGALAEVFGAEAENYDIKLENGTLYLTNSFWDFMLNNNHFNINEFFKQLRLFIKYKQNESSGACSYNRNCTEYNQRLVYKRL